MVGAQHAAPLRDMNQYLELKSSSSTELLLWLLGRRWRVRVAGNSMLPNLTANTELLVNRNQRPVVGDVVVARHPQQAELKIVKRVAKSTPNGYWLLGDNPAESNDSRDFGWIAESAILGVATGRFGTNDNDADEPVVFLLLASGLCMFLAWLWAKRSGEPIRG